MEIRQLKAFTAIVETGTFTAGAQRVHITQAAVSMQIRQLETEVGVPLFVRTPRRVVLTEAGEALLERARRILREHDVALAEMAELAGAERGRLRVGSASAMVSADPLPQILKELRERHPHADVSIVSGTSEALVRQILAGELDMAFVSLPVEARSIQTEVLEPRPVGRHRQPASQAGEAARRQRVRAGGRETYLRRARRQHAPLD